MRFKYPNLVDAALAASASIYLVAGKSDNYAFFGGVTKVSLSMVTCVCVCVRVAWMTNGTPSTAVNGQAPSSPLVQGSLA